MSVERIGELLVDAEALPEGAAKIEQLEQAVALSDSSNDANYRFIARKQLTRAAVFGGRIDLAMVTFAWTLSAADREPDRYAIGELLWQYKWLTENLPHIHTISQKQMGDLFADMARRYQSYGSTLHAVYQIRRDVAAQMGDRRTAQALDRKLRATERDALSNCQACVLDANVDYHLLMNDDASALEEARPALAGRITCGEVPHRTYAICLLPYLRLGRVDKAVRSHHAGYRLVRNNPKFISHQAYHSAFLTLTSNWNRSARVLNRHIESAMVAPCHSWTFDFLCATALLASCMSDLKTDTLPLPDALARRANCEGWPALHHWAVERAKQLADQFDARNGNTFFHQKVINWEQLHQYRVERRLDA